MRAWLWLSCTLSLLACSSDPSGPGQAADDASAPEPDAGTGSGDDGGICTSCDGCERRVPVTSAFHRTGPIDYPDLPPAGGDHDACWTTFGVHASEVPDERWVHNLEHGAVVFLHNCSDGCADERRELEAMVEGRPFALVLPYAQLPTRFGVVAWEHRLLSDCLDADAFAAFYTDHVNQAPESTTSAPPSGCP
jgi:hypothetical protein